jgi:hypothetical protein
MTNLFGTLEAEAARQLFYFMASRQDVDEPTVEQAWTRANLGIGPAELKRAIGNAARARASLSEQDQKRWGLYSVQRLFLSFLEDAGIREERVPSDRGEVVFYNLGKFSQLISDFETIHFHSKPAEKYGSFADFLQYRAESYYPEGWQDNQYANPDAVRIMTVYLARELLLDSGSVFVQIGAENAHLVKTVLDEVFGYSNRIADIHFIKAAGRGGAFLDSLFDILLWYTKDRSALRGVYNQLYVLKPDTDDDPLFKYLERPDGRGSLRNTLVRHWVTQAGMCARGRLA